MSKHIAVALLLVGCGPDLPAGWDDAERVSDLTQSPCAGDPYDNETTAVVRSSLQADPLQVEVEGAHFRCDQDVEAFFRLDGDRYDVLVQPIQMDPKQVAKCDCLYDLGIDVATVASPPESVSVYTRSDNLNDHNDPVLIGIVDGTVVCSALSLAECGAEAECTFISGRPLQDDGAGGECVDYGVPPIDVGCLSRDAGCTSAEVVATNPDDGATWLFPSGCLPEGWASVSASADECP